MKVTQPGKNLGNDDDDVYRGQINVQFGDYIVRLYTKGHRKPQGRDFLFSDREQMEGSNKLLPNCKRHTTAERNGKMMATTIVMRRE